MSRHGWRHWPPHGGPHGVPHGRPPWAGQWHAKQRRIFKRVAGFLALITLLVGSGMAILAYLLTRFFGGDGSTVFLVWLGGCVLTIALPISAILLVTRSLRSIVVPVTDIMAAIEGVAAGDLTVRIRESGRGEMGRLTRAFNHMLAELERSDRQRRNLTADVAHELRTPLHIIQGNLEGILDGVYEPTDQHIETTLEETRQLARLVEDLRTLSLAEGGELPLQVETVDVVDLLTDAVTSFSGPAEAAGLTLHLQVDQTTDLPLVVDGDAGRLDQVLGNLLANAIRHTPAGGAISLTAVAQEESIHIAVEDTGEGIAAEDLPFVFDRFWRGDRARSHLDGAGSGLGLAIASQLIKAHGGELSVTSQLGCGSRFLIELPRQKPKQMHD